MNDYPVEKVWVYDHPFLADYHEDVYCNIFERCLLKVQPAIVLIGGTQTGKSLAPAVATRFKTGLTADCTELKIKENSDLVQIRPAFGGNVMARIITPAHRPQFATVRHKIMEEAVKNKKPIDNIEYCCVEEADLLSKIMILNEEKLEHQEDITGAKVLIVAGQGIKNKDDLYFVHDLASLLDGQVASTRALVEKGWFPYNKQIGLSGKTVKPDLIITCGVSGSIQFMAGMKGAKNIIAINNDQDSSIFSIAHYPICGDLYKVLPELIKKIKKMKPYLFLT